MKNQAPSRWTLSGLLGVLLAQAITGCEVGPDYQRPAVAAPAAYRSATASEAATPQLGTDWWTLFGDPQLTKLEDEALQANPTLAAAMAGVDQARAVARGTASGFYPNISFDPSATRSRTSANGPGSGAPGGAKNLTGNNFLLPFDLSYEVDLWGQVRRAVEASKAQVQATQDEYEVVRQTLAADLAQDYFTLRSYDAQYQTLVDTTTTYRQQLELTQTQFRAGLESAADVASAQALLDATTTQQLEVQRERQEEQYAMAILLGRPPADFSLDSNPLNLAPPVIPAGLPADVLRRRPDVAEAERTLAAASAQVGVAASQFYPQLTLVGNAGFESVKTSDLLDWESRIWSIGPSVTFPLFNGGKLQAGLDQQKALYRQALALYQAQILTAYQDVENSLTDLHARADEATAQDSAVRASQDYVRLTQLQYQQGLVAYLDVIDADRTLLSNQLIAEQILSERLGSTVLLIKALGGGWNPPTGTKAP